MSDASKKNQDKSHYNNMSLGIPFGLLAGAMLGLRFGNIGIGAGLGMILGMYLGFLMDYSQKETDRATLIKVTAIVALAVLGMLAVALTPAIFRWMFS